ncbi:SRPBCC domain-containing protein [Phenylobacterium sp.]|uniref:SRPBCC family protein n=1 Tax=Phenylobacterium sp. TaxID=1871053 RepID=UPI002E2F1361|nr:SRPBCC domain-containing protein [Phenylobacterium sp.]HEX3365811.1 SRPBCC domain-containing protein [Phenylobacterium sp.]
MSATVKASRVIPANEAEVWETLTSREGMKAYMVGDDVEAVWCVGGSIVMRGKYEGKPFEDRGEVRSFEPWRRLSYTHTSWTAPDKTRVVTIELEPQARGTEVIITQENADGSVTEADERHQADYEKTWSNILEKLADAVAE